MTMFIETKEGQTHATCEERLKKYGGKAKCCLCNTHDSCTIADSMGIFSPHEMTKVIKHAGRYMKKEQDKIMPSMNEHIDTLAEAMLKQIANKYIMVQDTHEGKSHQRHWYLVAQKMLKKLVKEYEKLCKTSYD